MTPDELAAVQMSLRAGPTGDRPVPVIREGAQSVQRRRAITAASTAASAMLVALGPYGAVRFTSLPPEPATTATTTTRSSKVLRIKPRRCSRLPQ
jgi:hypothetical protein